MSAPAPTLGTLLRRVLDELDGAVAAAYAAAGLTYRPRYTPLVRALAASGPLSIRALARAAQVSHSAASQTVAQMGRAGLVTLSAGADGRERHIVLTAEARALLPALQRHWAVTNAAARQLEAELSAPLTHVLTEAVAALERQPFAARIAAAAHAAADAPAAAEASPTPTVGASNGASVRS